MGRRQRPGRREVKNWVSIEKENTNWENYYKELNLPDKSEWDAFKVSCQAILPVTFRITGSNRHAIEIRQSMEQNYIPSLTNIEWEGEKIDPPSPLSFYPNNLAWQIKVGKGVIRKNKPFAKLQRFLVVETEVGNISRQEAVSMIPPLLLDVQPHHAVMDLCAAPGSKTAQLIEDIHSVPNPTGFVVANDSDYKRSHMLTHQVKRLNSPNLIVTNHDAQFYPRIKLDSEYLKFDRVLCDVPCSGDGTMRKNINVWKDWTVGNGLGLHPTQINILARGIQMLKHGGRLVYSTCSLNPIENEAVVAEALRQFKNDVSLVDVSSQLPGLVRNPGISSWKVLGKDKQWQVSSDSTYGRSYFPPSEDETKEFNLDRCIRVYPHQQDTGGFFIAVFEKNLSNEEKKRKASPAPAAEDQEPAQKKSKQKDENGEKKSRLPRDANEEPFKFLPPDNDVLKVCWEFYGVNREHFPPNTLLVRNAQAQPIRTIYYVSPSIKPILELNESRLKFVHAGIKMFAQQKNDGDCKWRVQSEGLEIIYPYVGHNRVVAATSKETLKSLCLNQFPKLDQVKELDEMLYNGVINIQEGCAFLKVPIDDNTIIYPLWRGKSSINIMLPKENTQELLHRVFQIENVKENKNETKAQVNGDEDETDVLVSNTDGNDEHIEVVAEIHSEN